MTTSHLNSILLGVLLCGASPFGAAIAQDAIVVGDVVVAEAVVDLAQVDIAFPAAPAPAINPAAAADASQDDEDPQLVAIRQQFEPLMKTELSFANRVCQWTDAERIAAIVDARTWQRDFAREFIKNGGQRNRGMMLVAGNRVVQRAVQGTQPEKSLADALQSKMTDEQRTAYDAERTKRDVFRADATIDNIVAKMDQKLELTPKQRRQIRDALRKDWDEDWAPPLELFVQMAEYSPAFPDERVLAFLTIEQRALWQRVQKIQIQGAFFGRNMFGHEVPPINDVNLDEGQ
jgi:hypothetical protein